MRLKPRQTVGPYVEVREQNCVVCASFKAAKPLRILILPRSRHEHPETLCPYQGQFEGSASVLGSTSHVLREQVSRH